MAINAINPNICLGKTLVEPLIVSRLLEQSPLYLEVMNSDGVHPGRGARARNPTTRLAAPKGTKTTSSLGILRSHASRKNSRPGSVLIVTATRPGFTPIW